MAKNQPDLTNDNVRSYQIFLCPKLTLYNCWTNNCFKRLHYICQQNIDEAQYNGEFERVFSLQFCCSECIVEIQNKSLFSSSEDSEYDSDEEKEVIIVDGSTWF